MEQTQVQKRHETLYFDDGDLELSAKTLDGSTCQSFRVYRVQLRRTSPVFRDMLAVGGDREEVVDMPDTAEDISALLDCVFVPRYAC